MNLSRSLLGIATATQVDLSVGVETCVSTDCAGVQHVESYDTDVDLNLLPLACKDGTFVEAGPMTYQLVKRSCVEVSANDANCGSGFSDGGSAAVQRESLISSSECLLEGAATSFACDAGGY